MKLLTQYLAAACVALIFTGASAAWGQTNASVGSAASMMPLASVVEAAGTSAKASAEVPVALSVAGATLLVKSVDASATATVYVLERVSDGARVSVRVSGNVAGAASAMVGTTVVVSTHAAGTILTISGQVIAFLPNAVGRALLHNEQVSQ